MTLDPGCGPAQRVFVKMSVPTIERLDALAEEAGVTRSEAVRRAIDLLDARLIGGDRHAPTASTR